MAGSLTSKILDEPEVNSLKHGLSDCIQKIIRDELNLQPGQFEQFLRSRRSVRTYKKKEVDRDVVTKLIKLASFAPSGHNTQPVNWLVIYDSDEVQRLAGLVAEWMGSLIKEGSPLAAALHMDRVVAAWQS